MNLIEQLDEAHKKHLAFMKKIDPQMEDMEKELEVVIKERTIRAFADKIRKKIKNQSSHRVIDGRAPKRLRDAFKEGEKIGREAMRELALEIIDEEAQKKTNASGDSE